MKLVIANRAYAYDLEVTKKKEVYEEPKKEFKLIMVEILKFSLKRYSVRK